MMRFNLSPRRRTALSGLFLPLPLGLAAPPLQAPAFAAPAAVSASVPDEQFQPFEVRSSDGTVLRGDVRGDPAAPEILFIHGLRQSRLSWERQLADPALRGFRIVRFDLRGHGDSDKPAAPEAYGDMGRWADDIVAVIKATKLRRPVLVGWSLGGFVIGGYLGKYGGNHIAGINLVDSVIKLSPDLLTETAGAFTKTTTSHNLGERTAATADFLLACFHQPPSGADLQRMLVVNGMTARSVNEGFIQTRIADVQPAIVAFHGPILLTHGVHDRLVKVAMSERLRAARPDARLSLFRQSGHSPFYEEPGRYNAELAGFVTMATHR